MYQAETVNQLFANGTPGEPRDAGSQV